MKKQARALRSLFAKGILPFTFICLVKSAAADILTCKPIKPIVYASPLSLNFNFKVKVTFSGSLGSDQQVFYSLARVDDNKNNLSMMIPPSTVSNGTIDLNPNSEQSYLSYCISDMDKDITDPINTDYILTIYGLQYGNGSSVFSVAVPIEFKIKGTDIWADVDNHSTFTNYTIHGHLETSIISNPAVASNITAAIESYDVSDSTWQQDWLGPSAGIVKGTTFMGTDVTVTINLPYQLNSFIPIKNAFPSMAFSKTFSFQN